jgi:hypothetical protein
MILSPLLNYPLNTRLIHQILKVNLPTLGTFSFLFFSFLGKFCASLNIPLRRLAIASPEEMLQKSRFFTT